MMNNLSRWIPVATMLLLMAAGLVMLTQFLASTAFQRSMPQSIENVVDGEWTRSIEDTFENAVAIRDPSIHMFNALSYLMFGEARSGALVGANGWLFSREEFDWGAASETNLQAALATIARGVATLHARGIKVTLVFVPAKSDIYQDKLGRYVLPPLPALLYSKVLDLSASANADAVPDLAGDFRMARSEGEVFLHTDTHWSVFGAGRAAASICAESVDFLANKLEFRPSPQPSVAHRGDLLNFLELGSLNAILPMTSDTIVPIAAARQIDAADPLDALFGNAAPDGVEIALIGTSYSANPLWSFQNQLKIACQSDVLGLAADGKGPFEPMSTYLASIASPELVPPKLVIWEIPVRYLDDYDPQTLAKLF